MEATSRSRIGFCPIKNNSKLQYSITISKNQPYLLTNSISYFNATEKTV
jgi:hypothetical protein